jgi:Major Facilitator Superfamily
MRPGADQRSSEIRILCISTLAFAACFAVWTIFSIIGIGIKGELGLNETEFGLLIATPILTGSLIRMPLGIWSDRFGGRLVFVIVMLASAIAAYLLPRAHTYPLMLLAAVGLGMAGGSFAVGVSYVSRWFPTEKLRSLDIEGLRREWRGVLSGARLLNVPRRCIFPSSSEIDRRWAADYKAATINVPFMPASLWPGRSQENPYSPGVSKTVVFCLISPVFATKRKLKAGT